ncbi:MAG: hypothetical protein WCX79_00195 [Candidatus Paceibacterota bacterium]|jgi:hypothetical protein
MVRITPEIKNRMIEMREGGATYPQIISELGVTKERCIAYLKDITPYENQISAMSKEWRTAEKEAESVLHGMGFSEIHNLNNLCSFPPYWDYLAKQNDRWWLIDVTINGQKSVAAKRDATVEGYDHAILLKFNNKEWKLIQIEMKVINRHIVEQNNDSPDSAIPSI